MSRDYFRRLQAQTDTRLWINNPTAAETELAIAAGAINCTTNPAFCSRMFDFESDYIRAVVALVVAEEPDDHRAAERVYQITAKRLMDRFLPSYESSGGKQGFVTIQGDPEKDEDADYIVNEALRHARLGPNFMTKIPVTAAGSAAIEALVARDLPVCATEIFGIGQTIYICEAYERAARRTGHRPAFFVTHITGIFDEYLAGYVKANGVTIAPEILGQAGWAVAHEQYRLMKERGLPGVMLGGGARGTHHFTDMVGGDMHITINWSTAKELIEVDPPIESRIGRIAVPEVVSELAAKLPDFRRAYYADALSPADYREYGPLQHFRNVFLKGYRRLVDEVRAQR
jgi:transaldolase